jgi:hypothetical protein
VVQVGNQFCPVNAYFQEKGLWAYICTLAYRVWKSNGDGCDMKEVVHSPLAVILVETVELAVSTGLCILIPIRIIGI